MNKIILPFVLLFLLCTGYVGAQNYVPFPVTEAFLYKPIGGNAQKNTFPVVGYRFDTSYTSEGDSVWVSAPMARIEASCYKANGASWLGPEMRKKHDGTYRFINRKGKPITLKSAAALYESWKLYEGDSLYVKASIDTIRIDSFMHITDTIKLIRLQAYNKGDTPIVNSVLNDTLLLSRNYGLIRTIDFYQYGAYYNDYIQLRYTFNNNEVDFVSPTTYHLWASWKNHSKLPLKSFPQVFRFKPGDEFHIGEGQYHYIPTSPYKSIFFSNVIIKVIDIKEETPEHITYNIHSIAKKQFGEKPPVYTTEYVEAEWDYSFESLTQFGLFYNSDSSYIFPFNPFTIGKTTSANYSVLTEQGWYANPYEMYKGSQDSCYYQRTNFENQISPIAYLFGKGGPYYRKSIIISDFPFRTYEITYRTLDYWKSGDQSEGTPYKENELLGTEVIENNASPLLYPNPVQHGNNAQLQLPLTTGHSYKTVITSVTGIQMLSQEVNTSNVIHMEKLSPGMYVLTCTNLNTGERFVTRLVVY